jgi:hypothetical protein
VALYEVSFVARIPALADPPELTELGPVKFTGLGWTDELVGDGRLDIGAKVEGLDDSVKARLTELDQTPNELWLYRDGERVFAGPLVGMTIQGRKTVTLTAAGLSYYFRWMVRAIDYSAAGVDQGLIVKELVDDFQAEDYGDYGLDTTIAATGTARDLNLLGREGKTLQSVIATMGARDNGFDLSIDPFTRRVTLHAPRRGVDRSATAVIDRRNITQAQITISLAAGEFATRTVASSTTTTGDTLQASAVNSAAEAAFGRAMRAEAFSDISEQATLDDHAQQTIDQVSTPNFVASPQFVPVEGVEPGDVEPGDTITYDYDVGLGEQSFARRLAKVQTTVARGKERLAVTFI